MGLFLAHDVILPLANDSHMVTPLRVDFEAELVTCLPSQNRCSLLVSCTDDESPGLSGFLNVIVHSATGFTQSSRKWLVCGGRCQGTEPEGMGARGWPPLPAGIIEVLVLVDAQRDLPFLCLPQVLRASELPCAAVSCNHRCHSLQTENMA